MRSWPVGKLTAEDMLPFPMASMLPFSLMHSLFGGGDHLARTWTVKNLEGGNDVSKAEHGQNTGWAGEPSQVGLGLSAPL